VIKGQHSDTNDLIGGGWGWHCSRAARARPSTHADPRSTATDIRQVCRFQPSRRYRYSSQPDPKMPVVKGVPVA
jgi:hypothetical protein